MQRESRSAKQVLEDHLDRREHGELEEDLRRNYHPDVVMLTPSGSGYGHDGVRDCVSPLYRAADGPDAFEYGTVVCDGRMAFLEWQVSCPGMTLGDGVDTFLIEDGLIRVQTVRYNVTFNDLATAPASARAAAPA